MASALLLASSAFAQTTFNWYGFIRNYAIYDSHASSAGTEDLYYYMPNNNDATGNFNFVALTSRLGVDVKGYEVEGYNVAAKIEADFYNKNSTTAIMRLRQAYFTMAKDGRTWKMGQAWHPMAADMPDIFSLETGAPFGPFSRTPLVSLDVAGAGSLGFTMAAIWQMQYTSTGPDGATANYIKYGGLPELYFGLNLKPSDKLLWRVGADLLSIKPYKDNAGRLTTYNAFTYLQYTTDKWVIKDKLTYAQDGSHFNMVGGYGLSGKDGDMNTFSATRNLSDWFTVQYKGWGKWRPSLFLGYTKMFGTPDEVTTSWCKLNASTANTLYRIQPEITYNLGKVTFGLEYMRTSVQYGKSDSKMLATSDLHWVTNNRIQTMLKYTF